MNNKLTYETKYFDVVIAGGGMSGLCAALASARGGAKTALIQNRPVLGGNASSEIRMHICGADDHGSRPESRETGIIEEILLENRRLNPQNSFSVFDSVLWAKAAFQKNLILFLNTHIIDAVMSEDTKKARIEKVIAIQLTTEKTFDIHGTLFIDATGDGTLGVFAGAESMRGREGKDIFGEKHAPEKSDTISMGNSLLFTSKDLGYPVSFIKPEWAYTFEEKDLKFREHDGVDAGYWWIELGGDKLDVIKDGEMVRDELIKSVYGVWDHIKNGGNHKAENLVLDWVGFLPGKRESRRLTGDYVLKEQDTSAGTVFDDAVAYGGWPMDMHVIGGLKAAVAEPTDFIHVKDIYTIPYRCLYSKNIENLLLGGRAISVSHMAFGSTRDMATCSVVGQAVGTAAALAIEKNCLPRDLCANIRELQQTLIKDDCYIPGFKNEGVGDFAREASVFCSSEIVGCEGINVTNGYARPTITYPTDWNYWEHPSVIPPEAKVRKNCWESISFSGEAQWIRLEFGKKITAKQLRIRFDSNLSKEIMPSIEWRVLKKQIQGIPKQLVKEYDVTFIRNGKTVHTETVRNNYQRFKIHEILLLECDAVQITIHSTHGECGVRIFEINVY